MNDCSFCNYAGPNPILKDYGAVIAFEPLNPVVPGHMLFVPFRHVEDAAEEPYETARTVECASYHAKSQKQDFNLITSAGKAATQTVKHLHVHYIPRKEGDGLKLPWSDDA